MLNKDVYLNGGGGGTKRNAKNHLKASKYFSNVNFLNKLLLDFT